MTNVPIKISALPAGSAPTGAEVGAFVQLGATVKLTITQLAGGLNITRAQIATHTISALAFTTTGYATAGDLGAGGIYTSVGAGPSSIKAIQDAAGTWFALVTNQPLNVGWFGAKGDGVADDTTAIQACNDAAATYGGSMYLPATINGYNVTSTISITCRRVFGDAIFIDGADLGTNISWNPVVSDRVVCFDCSGADGATVEDITIIGPTLYSTSTLSSASIVTPGSLPNYSAFAVGVAGFGTSGAGKVIFNRCAAKNVKIGLLLNNTSGHVSSIDCTWGFGCLFGVYCRTNSHDYHFLRCNISAAWSGIIWGTIAFGGSNGGITASLIQTGIGFSPYCFYQTDDGGVGASNAGGYQLELFDTHFEAVGECVIQVLDSDISKSNFIMHDPPGFSWSNSFLLPNAIIASGSKQAYVLNLGNISILKLSYFTVSGAGAFEVADTGVNANGKIARIYTDSSDTGQFDHNALLADGPITIVNQNILKDNLRFLPIYDYQQRQERAVRSAVLQTPNMLLNPETTANWTVSNVVATLSDYTTLVGGALSTATFSRQFFEELGDDPNCLVLTPSSATWSARLPFNPSPFAAGLHCPAMSFWFVKAGSSFQYRARLECESSVTVYDNTYTLGTTATKIYGVGGNSGGKGYDNFALFTSASSNPVYVFGLMTALDDISQYNPTQGPSLIGMPFLQSQTTTASATGGAATLPGNPVAFLEVNIGGTLRKIPYYAV